MLNKYLGIEILAEPGQKLVFPTDRKAWNFIGAMDCASLPFTPQFGDVVIYVAYKPNGDWVGHAAIYMGPNQILHLS